MSNTFFCRLPDQGILSIQGIDSKKFLQGQLTCNLNYLSSTQSSLGAHCTAKGRMVSSFRVIQSAETEYLLVIDQSVLAKQLACLQKYAIFSKVNLTDVSNTWAIFGLYGIEEAFNPLTIELPKLNNQVSQYEGMYCIKIADGCFQLVCPASLAEQTEQLLKNQLAQGSFNDWQLTQIKLGIAQVVLQTSELFVPQMLNLPALGGVSFKKGCYLGQEIVARMQYLGKLKRHLYRFTLAKQQLPNVGAALISKADNSNAGEVVLAAQTAHNTVELLAVALDEALESGLYLEGEQNTPLEHLPLPYSINPDEEIKH